MLQIGDWVWFRHAKSGELAEHTNLVHLLAGDAIVDTVPLLPRARAWPGEPGPDARVRPGPGAVPTRRPSARGG